MPLSAEAIDSILRDFGGTRHTLDGPAQAILRTLYRQRAWISCGCRAEEQAPLWVLATRAQRVYLRQRNDQSHADGCPMARRREPSEPHELVTTRSEVRKRRWSGPARVLHPRQPDDPPPVERLASGQRVLRSHLMHRLLRELVHRAGTDRVEIQHVALSDGLVVRSANHFERMETCATLPGGARALRAVSGLFELQAVDSGAGGPAHTCVVTLAGQVGAAPHGRGCVLELLGDVNGSVLALSSVPAQDVAAPDAVGPWLTLVLVEHRDGSNHPVEASVLPVLATNILLPINHSADRPGLLAALIGARAAYRRGVSDLALSAMLFADVRYPEVDRDGVYLLDGPTTTPLFLSRHPGPNQWVDLSDSPARITKAVVSHLMRRGGETRRD